jgi:opacity protein-like surface antigen
MTLQNKIKKLVDRGGGMGQQILPVRIRNNNQIVNDTEGASWLGYFSEKDRTKGVKKGTELLSQAKAEGKDSVLFKNLNDTASKWYQKPSNQVAVLNPAVIRSPLATFDLRKLGLGGAGSYLSTDLMADELDLEYKPKPSMFKGLMETIGNANQQQAQAYGDTGANVASGVGSLLADPAMAAELAVRGTAGLGLGGLLMSNDVGSAEDPRFLERLR